MTKAAPPRLLSAEVRQARLRMAGLLTGLLAAAAFANPLRPLPIDLCLLKSLTGIPCPTCGLTRAVCRAIQGDFAGSLAMHPAGLIVVAALVGWLGWSLFEAWRGQPLWESGRRPLMRAAGALVSVTAIVFWIGELLS